MIGTGSPPPAFDWDAARRTLEARLDDPALGWWVAAALALALLVALLAWRRARGRVGRANLRRLAAAQRAEAGAERLVERLGYRVVDRQVTRRWAMRVDGVEVEVHCRADLLVARGGRLLVADVKTGDASPDPVLPATRRQLLEYLLAFGADGALVVDMVAGEVREVEFPGLLGGG
jgi:hypothetical protein